MALDGFVLDRRPNGHGRQARWPLDQSLLRPSFGLRNHPAGGNMSTSGAAAVLLRAAQQAQPCTRWVAQRVAPYGFYAATLTA